MLGSVLVVRSWMMVAVGWSLWIRTRESPSLGGFNGCVVVAREDMD